MYIIAIPTPVKSETSLIVVLMLPEHRKDRKKIGRGAPNNAVFDVAVGELGFPNRTGGDLKRQ
jgi:hypothetical protein